MRLLTLLLFASVLFAPTAAVAHSPYQAERARLRLDDGRVLSIRAHWGDGIIGADPVMAVAVIDDGTAYGTPVAIGPISDRGRVGVRCQTLDNCMVDYFGMGMGPDRSFRLDPDALRNVARAPPDWEWCVDHEDCEVSGFEDTPSPLITLEPLSFASLSSSAIKMAPVLLAILLIGLSGPPPKTLLRKTLRWAALATGGLFVLLALIWVPYLYLAASATSIVIDLALVVAIAMFVTLVKQRRGLATASGTQSR